MSAFAQLEDYMSKQTLAKIAFSNKKNDKEEYDELFRKFKEDREKETTELSNTKPEPSEVITDNKQEDKNETIESKAEEQNHGIDIDSVFKNVANRKRKKNKSEWT